MQAGDRGDVGRVQAVAGDAASRLRAAVPHSAAGATDDDLVAAVERVADLSRVCQTALAVLAAEVSARSEGPASSEGRASSEGSAPSERSAPSEKPAGSAEGERHGALPKAYGQRNAAALLQFVGRMSSASARRALQMGGAIVDRQTLTGASLPPQWEALADAAFAGELDAEAAAPIIRTLDEVRPSADPEILDAAERGMARIASQATPEHTKEQMRVWKEALDPDGARPREEEQRRSRYFRIGREDRAGMTPVSGLLTPDAAANLRAATSALTNPRSRQGLPGRSDGPCQSETADQSEATGRSGRVAFAPFDDGRAGSEGDVAAASGVGSRELDPRSHGQRLHDVIDGLVTAGLRAATTAGGSRRARTEVVVTMTLEDLRSGAAAGWVNGMSEPLGPVTTERIVCDEGYRALLLGDRGEALWLGRRQDFFTPQQKLAIAVRDETCGWPECDIPAAWCEVHHVRFRRDGGPTDVDNGILLCSAHHHMLHAQNWSIRMSGGVPYLSPPAFLRRGDSEIRLGRNRPSQVRGARRHRRRTGRQAARRPGADPP